MQSLMQALAMSAEFREVYQCFSEEKLAESDKVYLPPSALHKLASRNTSYPMLFQFSNPSAAEPKLKVHGGVLEFTSQEGTARFPKWLMASLSINEGALVQVLNLKLTSGSKLVLQPHSAGFMKLSNPRAVLEKTLSKFSTLTVGQSIPVNYLSKIWWLRVDSLGGKNAVSIVETDISVEFLPALEEIVSPVMSSSTPTTSSATIPNALPSFIALPSASTIVNESGDSKEEKVTAAPTSRNSSGNILTSEINNGFRYVYEITKSGVKRLVRREKYIEKSPIGQGYSLKKK